MKRTIVVGAGAIGLACAYALRQRGRDVLVIDKGLPGEGASKGNAGWITPSISAPIPAPGLTWTSLKWMLKSDSPLYIAPTAAPRLARWLWRFWRYCNQKDFLRGLTLMAELNSTTLAAFDALEADGVKFELHREGLLFVFMGEQYLQNTLREFDYYQRYGYVVPSPISGRELRQLEPGLSDQVHGGFLVKEEYHIRPETLTSGYVQRLKELGVEVQTGVEVRGAVVSGDRVTGVETTAGTLLADEVLVAAGAWSGEVLQPFGRSLPVQAGKGYSITVNGGAAPHLTRPLYLGEARIGVTPFDGEAVRFAGTMELSGVNTYFDPRRVRGIRKGIDRYLNAKIGPNVGNEWVGMRPLTPDGLPMLGLVPGFRNVYLATGHAMLGITLAPVTGNVMADAMTGNAAPDALAPFDPGRFNW